MALRRPALAERRKAAGFTQEELANELGVDRSTVVRWERGETGPLPYIRPKLARLLQVTARELAGLLTPPPPGGRAPDPAPAPRPAVIGPLTPEPDLDPGELDDMNRRELLRLISVAGTLVAVPVLDTPSATALPHGLLPTAAAGPIGDHELLSGHLWQVFALSTSKHEVYPLVRSQLAAVTARLARPHSDADHRRLCTLAADLFQLAGEIFFDGNRYTDAAYCYTLAASAAREADAYDLWACALTRHAFIGMHERRFEQVAPMLAAAAQVAERGDSHLSTRHWVAAVQAQTFAGLGDLDACDRALETAEQVQNLQGQIHNGGWLRFDDSRLAEDRGTCYVELGCPDLAADALTDALQQKLSPRRRGSVLTDLAALGIQRHDLDQLLHYAGAALELAQHSDSGYVVRRLQSLQPRLEPLTGDHRFVQLSHQITALTAASA